MKYLLIFLSLLVGLDSIGQALTTPKQTFAYSVDMRLDARVKEDLQVRGGAVIGDTILNGNASIEATATDKGILINRLSTAQQNAIVLPANGLMIYNTDSNALCRYDAADGWRKYAVGDAGSGGTVTSVSVTSANGLAGTVATATTTPAITLSTTQTGLLQGNGTAISGITNSSTVGQVIRVTGASTYAWGALNLADADAVTGTLPVTNLGGDGVTTTTFLREDGTWATPAGGSDWGLTGNSSTNPTVNFIGTTDEDTLVIKANNQRVGFFDLAKQNYSFGQLSNPNGTGDNNVAMGLSALKASTTGYHNTAIGSLALTNTTTGYHNASVGDSSCQTNVTGFHNTTIGSNSDVAASSTNSATALGVQTTAKDSSIAIGVDANATVSRTAVFSPHLDSIKILSGTNGHFLGIGASGYSTYRAPFTLTTTGSSGAATYSGGTLNIPQYSGAAITITNDSATATKVYPVWTTATSGSPSLYTSSPKLSFYPLTGQATWGTDSITEYACDVNGADCTTFNYDWNFSRAQNARTLFNIGNKNAGTSAAAGLFIGKNDSAQAVRLQAFYPRSSGWGTNAGWGVLSSGSGLTNGLALLADAPSGTMRFSTRSVTDSALVVSSFSNSAKIGINCVVPVRRLEVNGDCFIHSSGNGTGNIVAGDYLFKTACTNTAGSTTTTAANQIEFTGAGSATQITSALRVNYNAGYTGAGRTVSVNGGNLNAGTGNDLNWGSGGSIPVGNGGAFFYSLSTTTGHNYGVYGDASLGSLNIGVRGTAVEAKNSGTNIGGLFNARNTGSSPTECALYATLGATAPTYASAAFIADNADRARDIIVARDNGTPVFTVADGGASTFTSSVSTTNLIAGNKSINTTAGDAATINAMAGRFRKDASGTTFTLTNSFVTANSIVLLDQANAAFDATATSWTKICSANTITIEFNAAPTGNFDMDFLVIN